MDKYEFNNVSSVLYSFIWDDFCDNYIEMSKFSSDTLSTKSTLYYVLTGILKMLHPFMPFVTEEIYQNLPFKECESIMVSDYPKYDKELVFEDDYNNMEKIIEFIRKFRNVIGENKIPKTAKVRINNNNNYDLICKVLKLKDRIITDKLNMTSYDVSVYDYSMTIYFEKEENMELINKEIELLKSNIERRNKLLSNTSYVNKAPEKLVNEERTKLELEKNKLEKLLKKCK